LNEKKALVIFLFFLFIICLILELLWDAQKTDVIIVGEGITGLGIAYWLKKRGIDVTVLAKEGEVGGTMKSVHDQGFLYETGANTALETTPLIKELVSDLKLESEFRYANPEGKIVIYFVKMCYARCHWGPVLFFFTKLFSIARKISCDEEPFIGRAEKEESVAEFVERRLGHEFLDYAIDPFVAGVFAGKPERLSVRAAFPKLYALEEKYGGLVKGMMKGAQERKQRAEKAKDRAETFSFVSGMQQLPQAIGNSLGKSVLLHAKVTGVHNLTATQSKPSNKPDLRRRYLVKYLHHGKKEEMETDVIVFAIPAYDAAPLLQLLSKENSKYSSSIYYPPVISIFLGVKREDIRCKLDGFGFLFPQKKKRKSLAVYGTRAYLEIEAPTGMVD